MDKNEMIIFVARAVLSVLLAYRHHWSRLGKASKRTNNIADKDECHNAL